MYVLKICGGGGYVLAGNKVVSVSVHMSGEQSDVGVGVMSPWLFNVVYTNCCMRNGC